MKTESTKNNENVKIIIDKEIKDFILNVTKDEGIQDFQILEKIKEYLNSKIENFEKKLEEFKLKEEPKTNSDILISKTPNLDIKPIETQNNMNILREREDKRKIYTAFKKDDLNGTKRIDKGSTWDNYKEKYETNNENQNILNKKFLGKKRNKSKDKAESQNSELLNKDKVYSILKDIYENNNIRKILRNVCKLDEKDKIISNEEFQKLIETENIKNLLYTILNIHHSYKERDFNKKQMGQFYTDEKSGIKISKSQVIISKKPSPPKEEEKEEDKIDSLKSVDSTMSRGSSRYRKELGLGVHLHKDSNNNIYKYCLHHFLGETNAIFYCSDKECNSVATYNVDTKAFTITNEHSKEHDQHNYIMHFKNEKRDKLIMVEFEKKPFKDGQVFRRGEGKRIVQWYTIHENIK